MIYKGALKYGSLDVDCNPCIIRGEYFYQGNVLVVSNGVVMYKGLEDVIIVMKDKVLKVPIQAISELLVGNKQFTVVAI